VTRDHLIELERAGWTALSTNGDVAAHFYEEVLAEEALMLLPGGTLLHEREQIITAMRGAPWDTFALSDEHLLQLRPDCAVLTYRASAIRGDLHYTALFNSTYVLEGGTWRLALHQQTPV
jgi:hypothetical protein